MRRVRNHITIIRPASSVAYGTPEVESKATAEVTKPDPARPDLVINDNVTAEVVVKKTLKPEEKENTKVEKKLAAAKEESGVNSTEK